MPFKFDCAIQDQLPVTTAGSQPGQESEDKVVSETPQSITQLDAYELFSETLAIVKDNETLSMGIFGMKVF